MASGVAILGGWFVVLGTITIVRRKSLSATYVRWRRFWTGRNEDQALAEFDRAVAGWAAIAIGIMLVLFDLFD